MPINKFVTLKDVPTAMGRTFKHAQNEYQKLKISDPPTQRQLAMQETLKDIMYVASKPEVLWLNKHVCDTLLHMPVYDELLPSEAFTQTRPGVAFFESEVFPGHNDINGVCWVIKNVDLRNEYGRIFDTSISTINIYFLTQRSPHTYTTYGESITLRLNKDDYEIIAYPNHELSDFMQERLDKFINIWLNAINNTYLTESTYYTLNKQRAITPAQSAKTPLSPKTNVRITVKSLSRMAKSTQKKCKGAQRANTLAYWVEGHWRLQVCGPKNLSRKLIYVKPYLKYKHNPIDPRPKIRVVKP